MARWRLQVAHYINVPGTEWEYQEIDRNSGKQVRVRFPVPLFLNPTDPADHNYPGEIIVTNRRSAAFPKDIVFTGPPTPDMAPIDQEAERLTKSWEPKWQHPIDSLPGNYSGSLISNLEAQIAAVIAKNPTVPAAPVSVNSISEDRLKALESKMAMLEAENEALRGRVPTEEPLPPPEAEPPQATA